jgi:beta-N-acetylhexosaminidase
VQSAEKVVVAIYASPTAGKMIRSGSGVQNSVSMADDSANLMQGILAGAAAKTVVIAMGNPYVAKDFPEVQTYLCTFSTAPVSEMSAAKALFGEIAIHGRLPVSIPGIAARGDGLAFPAGR